MNVGPTRQDTIGKIWKQIAYIINLTIITLVENLTAQANLPDGDMPTNVDGA